MELNCAHNTRSYYILMALFCYSCYKNYLPTLTTYIHSSLSLSSHIYICTNIWYGCMNVQYHVAHVLFIVQNNSLLCCVALDCGIIHVDFHDALGFKDSYKTFLVGIPHYQFATKCTVLHALLDSILWIGVPVWLIASFLVQKRHETN